MDKLAKNFTAVFFALSIFLFSGCMMEASLTSLTDLDNIMDPIIQERTEPDFTSAEMVTVSSPSGPVVISGSFGDITTEVKTVNGATIEATFYQ